MTALAQQLQRLIWRGVEAETIPPQVYTHAMNLTHEGVAAPQCSRSFAGVQCTRAATKIHGGYRYCEACHTIVSRKG